MSEAITVQDLHLEYHTVSAGAIRSLHLFRRPSKAQIQALKQVSFSVHRGEILGIIGTNGSGKSTLLRTIAGIFKPDGGVIDLHGYSVSLLSLGLGFNPALSGRDNIFLAGLLMGFSEKQVAAQYDEIVDFAELGDAIARPVKTYSSGMYSKLAFAIAVTLKTDILLIDEVLSVGDLKFQQKSHAKMESLILDSDRTVLIVSHNITELAKLCDRVLWLEQGEVRALGDSKEVLAQYSKSVMADPANLTWLDPPVLTAAPTARSVQLSWNAVANAADYRVYRKEAGTVAWSWIADQLAETAFEDTLAAPGVQYLYTVRARAATARGNLWSAHNPGVAAMCAKD